MSRSILGAQYLLDGFILIRQPGLRRYVIIPLMINILLFIGAFFLLHYFMNEFNVWFKLYLPSWLQWLSTILWVLFFLGFFVVFIYSFVTVANILSAPFNSFLAEKVELHLTGRVFEDRSLLDNIKDIPRILARQLSIIVYYLGYEILILVLFFIPMVQPFAALVAFLFHAWIMTMTYIDYPTDNHRIPLANVKNWMRQIRIPCFGFGASVLVCSMIPVLNCFVIPAAVAGATKFWVEEGVRG